MSQYEANPNTPQMPPQNHPVNQMPYGNGGRPPMPPQQGYAPQNQYPPQQSVYPNGYQGAPYDQPPQPPQQPQQPKKGNVGKIALILLCLLMVVGIGLLMADQYDLFAAEEPHMQQGSNLPPADFQGNSNAGSEHSVHNWMDATYDAPKTCRICGKTEGSKLQVESVYINELEYYDKYGKVYYHDNQKAYYENNTDWRDLNTPGHLERPVMDGYGNVFTYGIHMDGDQLGPYYISYNLDGKYTTFSGWCVLPDFKVNSADANTYSKYFEIYCDGKRVFTSNTMRNGSTSQFFEIDITGVEILTIQYAPTTGPNDLAVLCDGFLK